MIAGAPSRAEQSRRINAYWDMCASVADYYLGLHEAQEIRRLQQGVSSGAAGSLGRLNDQVRVRLGTSLRAARAGQLRLASLMGTGVVGLPGDLPWCGEYNTEYDANFGAGGPPEALQLHELLPLRHAELRGATALVRRSERQLENVRGQSVDAIVEGMELLALRRRAFVQIARDYNRRITRYLELARPNPIDNQRLVGMLVGAPESRLTSVVTPSRSAGAGATFRDPRLGNQSFR